MEQVGREGSPGPTEPPEQIMEFNVGDIKDKLLTLVELINLYQESQKDSILDDAIAMGNGIIESLSHMTTTLQELLQTLESIRGQHAAENSSDSAGDKTVSWPKVPVESLEQVRNARKRYEQSGGNAELEEAIRKSEELLPLSSGGDAGEILDTLCDLLKHRYDRFGNVDDLESLTNLHAKKYLLLGTVDDLATTVQRAEEAVAAIPPGHPDLAGNLTDFSNHLYIRYNRFGNLDDLTLATQQTEEALETLPIGCPQRFILLSNLSHYLSAQYMHLGSEEKLSSAIKRAQEAFALVPTDSLNQAAVLTSLANQLWERYKLLGSLEDLRMSIDWAEQALAAIPARDSNRVSMLMNLSNCLYARHIRLENLQDLLVATRLAEEAVQTSSCNSRRPNMLEGLGLCLLRKSEKLGTLDDLLYAIQLVEEALAITPDDHPERPSRLSTLGGCYLQKYQVLQEFDILDKAIKILEESVSTISGKTPKHGDRLFGLCKAVWVRYERKGKDQDLYYALGINQAVWNSRTSSLVVRLTSAAIASDTLARLESWYAASCLFDDAVQILPQLTPRSLHRLDQQHHLSQFAGLAPDAATVALKAGKLASHSLGLLELGRGIIVGLAIDCRGDASDLQDKYLEKYLEFERFRTELDSLPTELKLNSYPGAQDRRIDAANGFNRVLAEIRLLPGFDRFLLPPSAEDLMSIASEGPIVVVTCTTFGSNAIILSNTQIKSVSLPGLDETEALLKMKQMDDKILMGTRGTYPARNRRLQALLLWLWDVVVKPVCDELQLQPVSDETALPHLWWIGVGFLAGAPFHSAGNHSPGSTENMHCRAISSYLPTVKALAYARQGKLELLDRESSKLLLVAMPDTPEHHRLPVANNEITSITNLVPEQISTTQLVSPSAEEVLFELQSHQAVHFACHGITDPTNPSESSLLLVKRNATAVGNDSGNLVGLLDQLTVGTIAERNMRNRNPQIAYLSACSTALNDSADLQDESIHIAGGFQLAGFSHVLATLWSAEETAAQMVAVEFYRSLFDGRDDIVGHRKVSFSFHRAVRMLREKKWKQPILWASFIHTGA